MSFMTDNQNSQYGVTTDEIMDYLKEMSEKMTTKDDLEATKAELRVDMGKLKLEIFDHMDEKLSDLKGDLVILMRKEDHKLISLIELLLDKSVITATEAKNIFAMEPFPKLAV